MQPGARSGEIAPRPSPGTASTLQLDARALACGAFSGGVAEWFKAAVLKTAFLKGNGGSNPSSSATLTLETGTAINRAARKPGWRGGREAEGGGLLNR